MFGRLLQELSVGLGLFLCVYYLGLIRTVLVLLKLTTHLTTLLRTRTNQRRLMMSVHQVNDVILRWTANPEGGLKPEDEKIFHNFITTCLAQDGSSAQLLEIIQDEKNQEFVKSMGCALLPTLTHEAIRNEKSSCHCEAVEAAITHLAKTCCPKQLECVFLQLVEDIKTDVIADTIIALAPHMQTVVHRMDSGEKAASLGLALSALQKQVSRLPVPYTRQQEIDDVHGLCRCCTILAAFIEPFVEELKRRKKAKGAMTAADHHMRTELLTFCMRSLRQPLLRAELEPGMKSPLWIFATVILVTLPVIQGPLPNLLFYNPMKMVESYQSQEAKESRACLAYLLFVELIAIESFPAVFSPVFVLQCNMDYINILLSRKDESHVQKGLALYAKTLEGVADNSLPVDLLDLQSFYTVPQHLRLILTDCPIQHLREKGLQVIQLFINKLDVEAKHKFFRCMLKTSQHAGLEGYIIKNIKNQIELSMKPGHGNDWFLGAEVLPLLDLVLVLPQGAETDLLHGMDRIMECLNLLRYLLIRDKEWKRNTGFWTELCRIKDDYIKMLRVCLSLSRAYYGGQLNALREEQKLRAREARAAARSTKPFRGVTVRQENVSDYSDMSPEVQNVSDYSDMSPEVQHQVLQSALVTFDLMESLTVRIEEITEDNTKSIK